ncbi:ankyrin repeat domain-containing protein [Azonexus sp.]|uniref:ankyrin repeat domain-containing protein n=1 Tax=Azonexus sp. TaxID=1872668 RepID=UPI002839AF44|nr:ankyrin repeat domain-containing protein [Azonexus sp.]MDR1995818.1 ankyrin repeat domain-containing protein [Azonexus sp.]
MIIALALLAPPAVFAEAKLPDPAAFANAMERGDLERAAAWLDAGLPPDFLGSRIGSGLMIGAWEGKIELMRLFISRGADINQANANGETALTLAAWRGNLEAARWLVERGARINVPARQWSPLHYAVLAGQTPVVDYLIAEGANINALSTNGSSVLMLAVYEGRQALAQKLIDLGADRTPRNDWGDGALEWAMRNNNLAIARILAEPEQFKAALNEPREKWGTPTGSLAMSEELQALLAMRGTLQERRMTTVAIDRRIAAERARIIRARLDQQAPTAHATTLEITASRQPGQAQSIRLVPAPANRKVVPGTKAKAAAGKGQGGR